jgi:hypothetical protein
MDYFKIHVPEKYGGLGLNFGYVVVFLEELNKCNSAGFAASIGAHAFLAMPHLLEEGSDILIEKYMIPGIKGDKIGCLAITEPNTGSDVAAIKTQATKSKDGYVINGSKTFITNGVLSDFLVVAAKTDKEAGYNGISLFLLDREMNGISSSPLKKLGWHASDTAEIQLDQVRVPKENLIGEENKGFHYIMQRFALERLVMAIGAIASCDHALDYSLQYMREREAFGKSINKFQELRHRVAQIASEIECCKYFNYNICRDYDSGANLINECTMAKLLSTQLADKVMYQCLQFFGGYGYMEDYKIARMFRDSRIGTIGGGTSEIMNEIISKSVIDNHRFVNV